MMSIDWQQLFVPSASVLELMLRGSIMYLAIFFVFRFFRRSAGAIGPADLLLVVLVADAAQNGMAGEYRSIPEGVILVATIVGWNVALDWLEFHVPALRPLLRGKPVALIENGRLNRHHLRSEMVTVEELKSQLREQGVDDLEKVKRACLEPDGKLSVVEFEQGDGARSKGRNADQSPPD